MTLRRWDVDPDYSPHTRPNDTYNIVYEDDRSEEVSLSLWYWEAADIVAAHNAEVALPTRDEIAEAIRNATAPVLPDYEGKSNLGEIQADAVLGLLRGEQ